MAEPMLELVGVTAGYGRSMVLFDVDLVGAQGRRGGGHGPQRRRQDDAAAGRRRTDPGEVGEGAARRRGRHRARVRTGGCATGLGYVPQGQLCFPQMTTMENLQLVSTVKSEIDEVLDTFPALTGLLSRRAGLLSGGQRQQLAIARTLLDQAAAADPRRADRGHPAQRGRGDRTGHRRAHAPRRLHRAARRAARRLRAALDRHATTCSSRAASPAAARAARDRSTRSARRWLSDGFRCRQSAVTRSAWCRRTSSG